MNYDKKIAELEARIEKLEALPEARAAREREGSVNVMAGHHIQNRARRADERNRAAQQAMEKAKSLAVLELPKSDDPRQRASLMVPTPNGGAIVMENPGNSIVVMARVELDTWRRKVGALEKHLANGVVIIRDLTPDEALAHVR